ncbi:helix-turn-helix domain-containing protein [Paenibacillus mucilaginosus]|uniref:Transcriptional regulator, AraC family n=1 Tax=Paenibacillus mucilaginosus (strain KNP414) TaxID=1036673 RepID=F8F577_PAEMK|nr:helix-turn-helix domain-containing protein [Paenibacillus mucilaginosus]AEI40807.1 transcriptional regulator, AraC family [Paenibacillus mucilaginosus KNP414]MCG7211721.1 helix-turn-helix domain-containing protein [Paenibacillus mucilaginosus]WDM29923.1 helix-turn-helix domain-containing protein [Paenibacillus mucilaginosus]
MRMNLYYRMLLSYTPIFFVVISVLIFSFYSVFSSSAENQLRMMNEAIAVKVLQAIDANLKSAERMVIKEVNINRSLSDFFTSAEDQALYDYFRISQNMDELSSILPFSNSIYLYNANTGMVLSRSGLSPLDQFGDRPFLESVYRSIGNRSGWTDPRTFKEFNHDTVEEQVVSLVKLYPYSGEKQGMIVINIRIQALLRFVKELNGNEAGPVLLLGSGGSPFEKSGPGAAEPSVPEQETFVRTKSVYTGWAYVSGGPGGRQLSLLSGLNQVWMIVGLSVTACGLLWFTYITHRNYKPIQMIAGRIRNYTKRKSGELVGRAEKDELKFIEAAIDGLLERAGQYEQLHKDDLHLRRRQMLFDWLEGHKALPAAQWKEEMARLQLPSDFERLTAAVVEIDRYSHFTAAYNASDRYLLTFVLSNVLQEIAQGEGLYVWNEWLEPQQMTIIFYQENGAGQERVRDAMSKLQAWTADNLGFTVSAGIGSEAPDPEEAPQSYAEAKEHVSYKPVFGVGALIGSGDLQFKAKGRIFPHLQSARTVAKSLRTGDGKWQEHLLQLYQELKKGRFSQTDIDTVTSYMIYHLHKEMMDMSDEVNRLLQQEYVPELEEIAGGSETLEEWSDRLSAALTRLEVRVRSLRSVKNNYALIGQVKEYIEKHYADPNLSLNQISDRFEMNPRYLSRLFKEEFGEKFIDYMLRVRLEEAQKLLLHTSLPVQDIAERVGYVHVISFHRAFKNMYGQPPGHYRKRADA